LRAVGAIKAFKFNVFAIQSYLAKKTKLSQEILIANNTNNIAKNLNMGTIRFFLASIGRKREKTNTQTVVDINQPISKTPRNNNCPNATDCRIKNAIGTQTVNQ
jgi:hypothetical protein